MEYGPSLLHLLNPQSSSNKHLNKEGHTQKDGKESEAPCVLTVQGVNTTSNLALRESRKVEAQLLNSVRTNRKHFLATDGNPGEGDH